MGIKLEFLSVALVLALLAFPAAGFGADAATAPGLAQGAASGPVLQYEEEIVPLERAGIGLFLERLSIVGDKADRQVLLVHGLTYSSHEFDVNVGDYSLARYLARQGYAVWTVDVAGYGRSQEVKDGFMPDSAYAAEDIAAAARKILEVSGQKKLDVLGWSWGTVTSALFAEKYPDLVNKLVLYAPILTGLGEAEVKKAHNHNTWEHAAGDFQTGPDGQIDYAITEPAVVNAFQSGAWRHDRDSSPNGGRRDLLVSTEKILIAFDRLKVPTLVIGGDKDPYLNLPVLEKEIAKLPAGSKFELIPGAAHAMMMEKPYYRRFRESVADFLK